MKSNDDTYAQDLVLGNMLEKPVKHYTQTITVSIHHFYITGEIDSEVDRYVDMLNVIKTSEAHDKIYIYLNTPGGDLYTTIQIISAINQSHAEVVTVLEGEVCSAGTFIFLSGHSHVVNDNCSFMIHNYSHGTFGKGGEVSKRVKFAEEYFAKLVRSIYKDFLTDEEIEAVADDRDFWMGSEEVIERLKKCGVNFDNGDEYEEMNEAVEEVTGNSSHKRKSKKDTSNS